MNYIVTRIVVGELHTNCYVVVNSKKEALIIDPGDEAGKIIEAASSYKIVGILVTHFHFDHIGALEELEYYFSLKANQKCDNFVYEVIETKGHTEDSISFYFPSIGSIFVGDFIFRHGIGRMDLGGNAKDMKKSIQSFCNRFSNDLIIYPGHGSDTTYVEEFPFLKYYEKTL